MNKESTIFQHNIICDIDINIAESRWENIFDNLKDYVYNITITTLSYINCEQQYCYELSILLCNDDAIINLNNQWRGKNNATNVLSFPLHDFRG